MDLYLRTDTDQQMVDALEAAGIAEQQTTKTEEGDFVNWMKPTRGVALQWLGEIPPVHEGDVMVKPGHSGVHVNLRLSITLTAEQMAALPVIDPAPTSPYCRFA